MLCVEDMEALFSCKEGFHIRVNNLRHVVILFAVSYTHLTLPTICSV